MQASGAGLVIHQESSGWWLPDSDQYFPQFVAGLPPKKNGFMREHLVAAFKHVREFDIAVDVGAHVGFWCHDLAERFETVYAFEANPVNFQCLVRNLSEFDNVELHNVAVGHHEGTCTVHNDSLRPGNTGSCYVKPVPNGTVPMVTLNQMNLPGCGLLKVDVEGFEYRVLCGATAVIKKFRPVVIMECTDAKFRDRYGIPEGEAQRWLIKRGYREVWAQRPDKVFVPS